MLESRTYVYQVLQGPWGIRVALTARVSMAPEGTMVTIPATESITFAMVPELYELLGLSGVAHLVHGAQAAQPFAGDRLQRPIVVVIENIRFVESDFQDDGLAAAVYGWLGEELEAPFPPISVVFDRQQNRYHFEWP